MNHKHTKASLIAFEDRVKQAWEDGDLPYLLHLQGGEEEIMLSIFERAKEGDWFFGSHRSHYLALLCGIPEEEVFKEIQAGNSMFLFSRKRRLFVSAILAGQCGIAVGTALALKESGSKQNVWCFLGDGAEESGHFAEAVFYAQGHNLPITFIVLDNNRQVDTDKITRRGRDYQLYDQNLPFQMDWPSRVERYKYTPTFPHAGSGCSHKITFKPKS